MCVTHSYACRYMYVMHTKIHMVMHTNTYVWHTHTYTRSHTQKLTLLERMLYQELQQRPNRLNRTLLRRVGFDICTAWFPRCGQEGIPRQKLE